MFRLGNGLIVDSKVVEVGRCMKVSDRNLCFSEEERGKIWKDYMERILNEESDLDHNVERDVVGPADCMSRDEVVQMK